MKGVRSGNVQRPTLNVQRQKALVEDDRPGEQRPFGFRPAALESEDAAP